MTVSSSRLNRWSRMKAESKTAGKGMKFTTTQSFDPSVEEEETVSSAATDQLQPLEGEYTSGVIADDQEDNSTAEEQDLPDIESLDESSDFTPFMSDKVSDAVRNMALRKLWRSNTMFANLDGLLDYGEDFTDAATVVTGMQTAYKVGRGMVDYEAEEAAKAAEAEARLEEQMSADSEDEPVQRELSNDETRKEDDIAKDSDPTEPSDENQHLVTDDQSDTLSEGRAGVVTIEDDSQSSTKA